MVENLDLYKEIVNENMKVVVIPWAFPVELDYDRLVNEYFKEGEKKYNKYINSLLEYIPLTQILQRLRSTRYIKP